ncbi:MAG: UDP-N-acetylmuramate--L-alanine ligase [Thermoanaerobaculia bacterium]
MPAESDILEPLDIYLIAIGGTGMAPLACLLKQAGHRVRGADGPLYPPMSTLLDANGIEPLVGYESSHLEDRPDLIIVGNAIPRTNPEAEAAEASGVERISMPEALYRFFLAERRPLVVAGTHGKTTTSALAAWVWRAAGRAPGFLIGGIPRNFEHSFERGTGERFIVEGDEYNAAYFDRGPKFFHYHPDALILTSVEYDHADLYPTPVVLDETYRKLVRDMPESGLLLAYGDSEAVRSVAGEARCRTLFYGLEAGNDLSPENGWQNSGQGLDFEVRERRGDPVPIRLPLSGRHNLLNALAVFGAAREDGIPGETIAAALGAFKGVKRRQEIVGTARDVIVIDDFAHHPTAVRLTLEGLRKRYPERRIVVALEPRSLTASRNLFFDEYVAALEAADRVWLAPAFHAERFEKAERLDTSELARTLRRRGTPAAACGSIAGLESQALESLAPGDLLVTMSSGSFGGLPHRIAEHLAANED